MSEDPGFLDQPCQTNLGMGSGIISLRGPKLTFRDGATLWVVLAGEAPRAWCIKLETNGVGPARGAARGTWSERRPPADELLFHPDRFAESRETIVAELRSFVTSLHNSGKPLSNQHMIHQRSVLRTLRKLAYLTKWLQHFPPDALRFLDRQHFHEQRWHLLNLWLRVPQGRELFEELPAFAWMLSASWRYKLNPVQRPLRSLRTLATKTRRHVLRWLDLPEGDGTLHLLGRYRGSMMNKRLARALCIVLRSETKRRILNNLAKAPDYKQLRLLAYDMPVTLDLLRAINEGALCGPEHRQMPVAETYRDTFNMIRRLNDPALLSELGRIRSPGRLRQLHDRIVNTHELLQNPDMLDVNEQFNLDSPLLIPAWLIPLRNNQDIKGEAVSMRHCAQVYASKIALRYYYIYAVHHPLGRATLGILRTGNGRWELSQLYGCDNSQVSHALRTEIRDWLRKQVAAPDAEKTNELTHALVGQPDIFGMQHYDEDDIPF